jgi:acyl dehydratase
MTDHSRFLYESSKDLIFHHGYASLPFSVKRPLWAAPGLPPQGKMEITMTQPVPTSAGQVRVLRDSAGMRTTYEELEIGKDLGTAEWTPTQAQIDQVCERMEDHHPYYEVNSPFGSTVVPVGMTYLLPRELFSQTYSVRGLFYKWAVELLEPIRAGVRYTVQGTLTEKWIKNDHEFVAYESTCRDPDGKIIFKTRRAHVLDFIKRTAPKVGESVGTSDARTSSGREARKPVWDENWPAGDTAAGTGNVEVIPLADINTAVGARLPSNSLYFSRQKFFKRQNQYFTNPGLTLHLDEKVAQQEGLPGLVAGAPDLMALCYQSAMQFFGSGWVKGGRADLTSARPTYIGDYVISKGVVISRESQADGSIRLNCNVWVEDQKGEKKVVGSISGVVFARSIQQV